MAKVFGPALSITAKGKVGKGVAFQRRPGGAALTKNPVPSRKSLDDPSPAKQAQRNLIKQWVEEWQALPAIKREYWSNVAKELGTELSGYHQFMKAKAIATMPVSRLRNYWPEMMRGLVGYWAFDEGEGGIVKDLSGQGNDGILKPSYPDNCPLWVPGKSNMAGKALSFDGLNDYVDCGNDTSLNITDAITVEVWINRKVDTGAHEGVVGKFDNFNGYWLGVFEDDLPVFDVPSSNGSFDCKGTTPIALNTWYHLVGTFDGSTVKMYVNGVLEKTLEWTGTRTPSSNPLTIGEMSPGNFNFNGKIDEVRIYNRTLTPAEILEHYNLLK